MTQTLTGPAADRLAEARRSREHGLVSAAVTTYALAAELAVDAAAANAGMSPIDPGHDPAAQRQDRARTLASSRLLPTELPEVLAALHAQVHNLQQAGVTPKLSPADFSRVDATIATALSITRPAPAPVPQAAALQQPIVLQQRSSPLARVAGTGCAVAIGVAIAVVILAFLAFRAAKDTVRGALDDAIELVNPAEITGPETIRINKPATFELPTAEETPRPTASATIGRVRLHNPGLILVAAGGSAADGWTVQLAAGPSAKVRRNRASPVYPRRLKDGDRIKITVRQGGQPLATKTVTVRADG